MLPYFWHSTERRGSRARTDGCFRLPVMANRPTPWWLRCEHGARGIPHPPPTRPPWPYKGSLLQKLRPRVLWDGQSAVGLTSRSKRPPRIRKHPAHTPSPRPTDRLDAIRKILICNAAAATYPLSEVSARSSKSVNIAHYRPAVPMWFWPVGWPKVTLLSSGNRTVLDTESDVGDGLFGSPPKLICRTGYAKSHILVPNSSGHPSGDRI